MQRTTQVLTLGYLNYFSTVQILISRFDFGSTLLPLRTIQSFDTVTYYSAIFSKTKSNLFYSLLVEHSIRFKLEHYKNLQFFATGSSIWE